ncbi:unnamed protein product [Brugia pahangi]|uniref:Mitochondrial inner membrane protein Mpv17 n=1 Tax=Brugia pahangi TaxID=6280 RepID=A0A0N4SWI9_BRUPA|nr:unnamed protein product [Brugia pahangi]
MYRSNNFSNRCSYHHQEHSQCNVGPRRSALHATGGTSLGLNRRHFAQRNHAWSIPELVRETGLILEVQRDYGRILSQSNFSTPNVHIYFSLSTLVNDAPLSVITDNLADVFQAGAVVEIEVEGGVNLKELKHNIHVILTCTSIRPSTDAGHKPELVPMVVIQDDCEIPLALITNHELVALPRQVFPVEEVTSAFMAKKNSVITDVELPEFATIGRSVEGGILSAPPWIREFTNPAVKKIALSVQRFGRDREGFAVIKEYIGRGVILTPIDEDDKQMCGDMFYPYEMRVNSSYTMTGCEDVYRLGSKWYFRACPELPNRKYKYRVYSLNSLDAIISGDLIAQEQLSDHTVIKTQGSVTVDVSTSALEANASTNDQLDNSNQLIEFDDKPLTVSSPNAFPKPTAVSPVTLNLLSTVNFDASHAATASGINETMILQNPNPPDVTDRNLLVDFNVANEVQQVAPDVRHLHILDEDFTLSSFNFDFKEAKSKAEMFGYSNYQDSKDVCMASLDKESRNVDLNHINGFKTTKEQPAKVESSDCSVEFTSCKPKNCVENCSVLCNGNSVVEQLVDFSNDLLIVDQETDTSDDDSENEMFHAVSVKRESDDGWWFTRRISSRIDSTEDRKANVELGRLPYCNRNSEAAELNPTPKDDKPPLFLTEDHVNCEATSVTITPELSLTNTLQNDGEDLLFRMLLAVYRAYERALVKYPFLTQASSAGALAAMADMLTQNFVEKRWQKGNYNPARTIRFSALILFWIAPITYRWFLLLEKLKGKTNLLPLKRMILDQSLAAPLFTFSFITNLHILEGNSPHDALEKAKKDIVPVMKTNYKAGFLFFV